MNVLNAAIVVLSLTFSLPLSAQERQCGCATNKVVPNGVGECPTIRLSNGSKLYCQFNFGAIWFTLENKRKEKIILQRVDTQFQGLVYRLAFTLVKEFKRSLLCSHSCPANGPCYFLLIDKYSGQKIKDFGILIDEPSQGNTFNFVAYLSRAHNYVNLYFPDKRKLLQIKVDKHDLFYTVPEYQFDRIQLHKNIVTMNYETSRIKDKSVIKTITPDVSRYAH